MLQLENLCVEAGAFKLKNLSMTVPAGTYAVLMGPTGCGKTTLLEAVCGLREVTHGRILLADRDLTNVAISDRRVGYVPQDAAIFPTMTVRKNIGFAPLVRGVSPTEIDDRVNELADHLSISHLLDRPAQGLSGGEKQRVALGRALAAKPELLLLDEPLSALDDKTKSQMVSLLKAVQAETKVTTLHVTHNKEEAVQLADEFHLLSDGKLIEKSSQQLADGTFG